MSMSITLISSELRKARKVRPCTWCGQQIEPGQTYRHERLTVDGDFGVNNLHPECDKALAKACREEGGEVYFDPGQNERPAANGTESQ